MLPWDLVATGLERFLRLGYIATTVSGATLIAEVAVLTVDGPPAHRRDVTSDWITNVPNWHVKTTLLVLLIVGGVLGAYFLGATARLAAIAVFSVVTLVYHLVRSPLENARRRRRDRPRLVQPPPRPPKSTAREIWDELRELWDIFRRRALIPMYFGFRAMVAPVFPLRLKSEAVWASLEGQFGRESLARVLEGHPIQVEPGDDEYKVLRAIPYCQLWLQRYTPDVAISATARRTVLLLAAIPPAVLFSPTLHALTSDLSGARPWLGWTWLVLALAFSIAVINSLREGPRFGLSMFYRFVLLQFVEEGRPAR
jgi:hypothetical protein